MPIYVYQADAGTGCASCRDGFERLQKLGAKPLTQCPRCLAAVHRVVSASNLALTKPGVSESNIARHGFTQFRKAETGIYEKTAGTGPDLIREED